jgi:DNA polymerase-3 subunit epsilon
MLDWLKILIKNILNFWKTYVSKFDKNQHVCCFIYRNFGNESDKDVILSIGSFAVIDNSIVIGDSFEAVLLQYKFLHDNGLSNEFFW